MSFYELVVVIRQDVVSSEIDSIIGGFVSLVEEHGGRIIKKEYWGLRTLAYKILNNKKAHYYLIGMEANDASLDSIRRKLKLSESVIRSSIINVKEIENIPSPILQAINSDDENTVDVTIKKTSTA